MKAPKFPSFFKTTKNKQFELPVRYYDERKERIQTAIDKANNQQDGNLERGHFANSWKNTSTLGSKSSSFRVITITIILCLITYWILKF